MMEEAMPDPQAPIMPVQQSSLLVVQDLLKRLHKANLIYCRWKGNEYLDEDMAGCTNLEVLVERGRAADLQMILAESGFRRLAPQFACAQAGIEDYLGFDQDTGNLVLLRLHYQLSLGDKHYSPYRLPWEGKLLATRVLDARYDIYVANPAIELLLLLIRAAANRRFRGRIIGQVATHQQRFRREFARLRDQVDIDEVCRMSSALLGSHTEHPLRLLLMYPERPKYLRLFARAIQPTLRRCRTYPAIVSPLMAAARELQWLVERINQRYLHRPVPLRRTSPRGGAVIVLVGSPGAGKSSLGKVLTSWLGANLDVMPLYFGSGDGPSSMVRLPFVLMRRLLAPMLSKGSVKGARLGIEKDSTSSDTLWKRARSTLHAVALVPWALALSLEKRSKIRRMVRARNRGMIVVCDRFAQADFPGFNDGPLLTHWRNSRSWILRAVADWEAKPHKEIQLSPPDLVLRLNVTPEVALTRRPEMSLGEILMRVQVVQSLKFSETTKVFDIRAGEPFEDVVLAVKKVVWEKM